MQLQLQMLRRTKDYWCKKCEHLHLLLLQQMLQMFARGAVGFLDKNQESAAAVTGREVSSRNKKGFLLFCLAVSSIYYRVCNTCMMVIIITSSRGPVGQ